jgi:cysteinyl-tRNA synthetase
MALKLFKKPALPPLKFHNTLSGLTESFEPMGSIVKMYNCGPTVYDFAHIGNLRSYVFADTLRRALDTWGYKVKQVINITDFGHLVSDADEGEDKMTKGLQREGLELTLDNMRILAEKYTAAFLSDLEQLGIHTDRITFPRASAYISEQIALISTLEQKGYAYQTTQGVYFDISRFPTYGKLGNINIAGQQEGARIEINKEKRGPADFILWKSDNKLGWKSPWGLGFPGWHIECTAMIFTLLGKQIDIHTGGIDHIAVHHNNEIAQAEAATGKPFVHYWMHGEFITIEAKRVGKSMGNAIILQSLLDRGFSSRALRYWYLTGHYRTPMNFTWEAIEGANTALGRLARLYHQMPVSTSTPDELFLKDFYAAIAEDLNTAQALARVWDLVKDPDLSPTTKRASLFVVDKILGLGLSDTKKTLKMHVGEDVGESEIPTEITHALAEREEARRNKDFILADTLRQKIKDFGYEVTDTSEGQKIART